MAHWRLSHEYVYTPIPLYPKSVHYFRDKIPRAERGGRALPTLSDKRVIAEEPVSDLKNAIYTSSQYKPKGFNSYTLI